MSTFSRAMIDIGANLTDPMFKGIYNGSQKHGSDLNRVIERAFANGVEKIIITSGCLEEVHQSLEVAKTSENLFTTAGCHPTRCLEFEKSDQENYADHYMGNLVELCEENKEKIVAVGEFGLDFDRLTFCPKDVQLRYFEKQLEIAERTKLPLFLHCRNAADSLLNILIKNREKFNEGVVHSFDGTLEEAEKFMELGLYIGINGCSLKSERNLQVVKQLPKERMMIETDSPWCEIKQSHASFPFIKTKIESKKKEKFDENFAVKGRNEPSNLIQVLEVIAAVKNEDIDELAKCLYENTVNLFFNQKVTNV
ncbi:putative deoxyribonuclease TATDN1-like protein [Dinothrombium tinctorium]|uniref:Deoxyribonuclease TATDN1 n=1 Tax=Dinothrombium tinctorium TaxID=1965070 RepID=A0A3S4R5V5_9ACAR|nr:putative deoxyribonuclease TATDN1-like protein [Dinothrombium tinctorium]